MNRPIIIFALFLLLALITDQYLAHSAKVAHQRQSQLQRLPNTQNITASAVREFRVVRADTAWTYRWQNGNWHYPAYENVFALNDRVGSFLKDTIENYGTIVAVENHPKFGFEDQALSVHLTDSTGTWQQTVDIGYSLPGTDTREAYAKVPQTDTIYHIHADPIRSLMWERMSNRPPFVDPKILPTALSRRGIRRISFTKPNQSVQMVEREEVAQAEASPVDGPQYQWFATLNRNRQPVVNTSVYAYLSFINRLKFQALLDPTQKPPTEHTLMLTDDEGVIDTLEVGKLSSDLAFVHHRTTGHLYQITPQKAELLFLSPALLDTLPNPTPYQQAEPTGAFSLSSP